MVIDYYGCSYLIQLIQNALIQDFLSDNIIRNKLNIYNKH